MGEPKLLQSDPQEDQAKSASPPHQLGRTELPPKIMKNLRTPLKCLMRITVAPSTLLKFQLFSKSSALKAALPPYLVSSILSRKKASPLALKSLSKFVATA